MGGLPRVASAMLRLFAKPIKYKWFVLQRCISLPMLGTWETCRRAEQLFTAYPRSTFDEIGDIASLRFGIAGCKQRRRGSVMQRARQGSLRRARPRRIHKNDMIRSVASQQDPA